MNKEDAALDLDAYLSRIEYSGSRNVTAATLRQLHRAHTTHIPFENLDILLGKSIRLDLESLQTKLVRNRRGGYCFEQNALLAAALGADGFCCYATRGARALRLRSGSAAHAHGVESGGGWKIVAGGCRFRRLGIARTD